MNEASIDVPEVWDSGSFWEGEHIMCWRMVYPNSMGRSSCAWDPLFIMSFVI